jgi:excisionase family DNA binding protein
MKQTLMISLSVDELFDIITKSIKTCLADWQSAQPAPGLDRYITRVQACERLHISTPTVHAWVKRGILKSYHVGGRTLFRESEVMTAATQVSFDFPTKKRGRY